jgi:hypothetical protein
MAGNRHVAVEHANPAGLDATGAGDDASSDDLPTPSGPINPTVQPLGMASVTESSAQVAP